MWSYSAFLRRQFCRRRRNRNGDCNPSMFFFCKEALRIRWNEMSCVESCVSDLVYAGLLELPAQELWTLPILRRWIFSRIAIRIPGVALHP